MKFLKKRELWSHKGDNGKVLVIGGSKDYIGAPALAALAALRTGIDLSVVAAPEQTAWQINTYSPDLITKKFEGDFFNWDNVKDVIDYCEDGNFNAILIGPGLGLEPNTMDFVKEVVERIQLPKVIDADALKALKDAEIRNAVLTPHKAEFYALTDEKLPEDLEEKAKIVKNQAKKDKIILLKGHTDIITDGNSIKLNQTGNPGMTIGGTGDVLAGLCLGFLAQTKDLLNSAHTAAYLNGRIGDYLLRKKGYGFTASDMIELIPIIKKKIKWI
ncbi:NAD(P)H-hydrate dehydratase [Candidatus Woesearchaeota archaeon]|nr:NAD(P)H-hydrate dehydratase [Candidatus Woesearchaeota archaeon]